MSTRLAPKVVLREPSPNVSQRISPISLIVIHDTEGGSLASVGSEFASTASQVSAHVCTDSKGESARYVRDEEKAWQCVAYNSAALGIEQIGFASQKSWPAAQVDETARWVARWSQKHGIPIRRAIVLGGRVVRSGVITHEQLGAAGGGHHDPGPNYPMGKLRKRARFFRKQLKKKR